MAPPITTNGIDAITADDHIEPDGTNLCAIPPARPISSPARAARPVNRSRAAATAPSEDASSAAKVADDPIPATGDSRTPVNPARTVVPTDTASDTRAGF